MLVLQVKLSPADGAKGKHELARFLQLLQGEEDVSPDLQVHLNCRPMVDCMLAEYLTHKKIRFSFFSCKFQKNVTLSLSVMMSPLVNFKLNKSVDKLITYMEESIS